MVAKVARFFHHAPIALAVGVAILLPDASGAALGQEGPPVPPASDLRIRALVQAVSRQRIESDIRTLAGFGTRHTLSDTMSPTRGIGAARRWIKAELERVSETCGGCLEVSYHRTLVDSGARIPRPTWVINVLALLRGATDPERHLVMTAHYDSRASDVMDAESDAPGANDDASGTAALIEAARVLASADRRFAATIVFAALAGEEQGLFGGHALAAKAVEEGWSVEANLNNDIVGNTRGENGLVDNTRVRVFSESPAAATTSEELARMRVFGGEVDSPSRQLARYVDRIAETYLPGFDVTMIYRLDRFGRGGDHRAFNDAGFPAVRLSEPNENYRRQHQDVRVEEGMFYGDVADSVDFDYVARVTAVNVATLASLAWAPASPDSVTIAGAVEPSARLSWAPVVGPDVAGYKVYWRATTSPTWDRSRWVGTATEALMENLAVDDWLFGVASVGEEGDESVVVFPRPARR